MSPNVTVALPTEDRSRAHAFHRALGIETPGEPAEDGVPEPLRLALAPEVEVMLVPTGGFGWVTAGRTTADRDTAECLITLAVADATAVDTHAARVREAGGVVVAGPESQPWGYCATYADPDGHLWQVLAPTP